MSRAAIAAALALGLAACSSDSDPQESTAGSPAASSPSAAATAEADDQTLAGQLEIADTWVKAASEGMTAAFGVITNTADHDVVVVGAHSDATSMIELHEVVDDTMRPVEGGLVVPAGGSLTLEPGGYHLMFMDVTKAIAAGDEISIVLDLEDGSQLEFTAVAKDFSGGNEEYQGGMDMGATPSASPAMDMNG